MRHAWRTDKKTDPLRIGFFVVDSLIETSLQA